jgi:hypothetical protein
MNAKTPRRQVKREERRKRIEGRGWRMAKRVSGAILDPLPSILSSLRPWRLGVLAFISKPEPRIPT